MKRIVIFASGNGTNAENIVRYFNNRNSAVSITIFSNNRKAKVLERAKKLRISAFSFNKVAFFNSLDVLDVLKSLNPDLIVLAGFLWKIPESIVNQFSKKIINIHPSLLPKFGGKGMYGIHVHDAVVKNKEIETGITIHYVNENYDEGSVIYQKKVSINPEDTSAIVADKVKMLEQECFPKVIESILMK